MSEHAHEGVTAGLTEGSWPGPPEDTPADPAWGKNIGQAAADPAPAAEGVADLEPDDLADVDDDPLLWGPSREEWEATQAALHGIGRFLAEEYEAGEEPGAAFDPFDEGSVEQYVAAKVEEQVAPYRQIAEQAEVAQGEEEITRYLGGYAPEFTETQSFAARQFAVALLPQFNGDGYAALGVGAEIVRRLSKEAGEQAIQGMQRTLSNIAETRGDPGVGEGTLLKEIPTGPDWGRRLAGIF